jgi:small subunit ribosomal protein S16
MLKIRLQRVGRKNDAHFRIIVTPHQNKVKTGKFTELVGSYNVKLGTSDIKADRVNYWISQGAQTTETVHNMLVAKGIIEGKKKNVLPKKSKTSKRKEK